VLGDVVVDGLESKLNGGAALSELVVELLDLRLLLSEEGVHLIQE
jgi:hypothetical protein